MKLAHRCRANAYPQGSHRLIWIKILRRSQVMQGWLELQGQQVQLSLGVLSTQDTLLKEKMILP